MSMTKVFFHFLSMRIMPWAEKSIPEKTVVYVRGKHCGLPGLMQTSQNGFPHTWD